MSVTIITSPPPRDPRTTRHSMRLVRRAKELREAGWTAGETRRQLAKEFELDRPPSESTVRSWTEPGYRERHQEWQRKCAKARKASARQATLTPELLLELRTVDGHTYEAIAKIARRFYGVEMSPEQIRYGLYRLGAPKHPARVRAAMKVAA